MISFSSLISFIITCLVIEATPGPNMGYLALVSAREGRWAGFYLTAGIALGLLLIGLAAALGVAVLISSSPFLYELLRWGGVLYLVWLAWESWQTQEEEPSPEAFVRAASRRKFFRRGLITNLLNPKAALFYVAILPSFVEGLQDVALQTVSLTIAFVFVATLIHSFIVVLAGSLKPFLTSPARQNFVRRFFSFLLFGIALWFAWSTAR